MADRQDKFSEDKEIHVEESDLLRGEAKERYQEALKNWNSKLARLTKANRASERLGREDFEIRINTRG